MILALIVAYRANLDLNWDTAAAIDLADRHVLEAVQVSVNPTRDLARGSMTSAVAKDGIQLNVRVRVTVIAFEQEMKALTRENQTKVVLAEAQIPVVITHAFRTGQLRTEAKRDILRKDVTPTEFQFPGVLACYNDHISRT